MGRTFFASALDNAATWWRIYRRDGVALGLTSHDRDLWFDGICHRAAPGMVPSAIRLNAGIGTDSAEVTGALSHDAVSAADLIAGRFDGAAVEIGLVDWENLERASLYHGEIGPVWEEAGAFGADLLSAKAILDTDLVPRTSPTCRAEFCGPGCGLSSASHTHELSITAIAPDAGHIAWTEGLDPALAAHGSLRWLDGPSAGARMEITRTDETGVTLDRSLDPSTPIGTRVLVREGCDHTFASCSGRFRNGANFRGEPFLPGNDLIARYPTGAA